MLQQEQINPASLIHSRSFYRQVFRIMIPILLQQIINMGVNTMDTLMLGSIGAAQLSASSLATSFYTLFVNLCMGVNGGCMILASRYWGSQDKQKVRDTFNLAIVLVTALSIVFAGVTALFPSLIMQIYSNDPQIIAYGVQYLRITAFIYFFHGTSLIASLLMRSVQNAFLGFTVSIVSFVVNTFFNWIFIYGKLGAPRMEIAGAALGTLIARLFEFFCVFLYIFWYDKSIRLRLQDLLHLPSREIIQSYTKVGVAALLTDAMVGFSNNLVSIVLGRMGTAVVAANAICQVTARMCLTISVGLGNAAGVVIGNTIGRGERTLAIAQGKAFFRLSMIIGLGIGASVAGFGLLSVRFFSPAPDVVPIANEMILAYGFLTVFQTVQFIIMKGVLRSGGDTKFLLFLNISLFWLAVPCGFAAAFLFNAPAWVTLICLRIEYLIKTILGYRRMRSGKWLREINGSSKS